MSGVQFTLFATALFIFTNVYSGFSNGIVFNSNMQPLQGVTVTSKKSNTSVLSKADGSFKFEPSSIVRLLKNNQTTDIRIQRNMLIVSNKSGGISHIKISDLHGKTLYNHNASESGNECRIVLDKILSEKVLVLSAHTRSEIIIERIATFSGTKILSLSNASDNITTATSQGYKKPDTLTLTKKGYIEKMYLAKSNEVPDSIVLFDTTLNITLTNYPQVDGSTSAQPMALVIASHILDAPYMWRYLEDGTRALYSTHSNSGYATSINNLCMMSTTSKACLNVVKGVKSIALMARKPSEDELDSAAKYNVSLTISPIAIDAFVFLLNSENPIQGLTLEQYRSIYSGKVSNWNIFGGPDTIITGYQRQRNSGSQELFIDLVMGTTPIVNAPPHLILDAMISPFVALDISPWGICYSVYFYKEFMAPQKNVKAATVNGIIPEFATIQNRTYPLTTDVYLASRTDLEPTSKAAHLRDWLLSAPGQKIIKESGYVPVKELN